MSYQVLARKWRPHSFADMVGQEHILRMLSNALTQQRLHHAYLFTGTRGVGKTTLARILAKCLNCATGITPTPCGTCANCQAIDAGQYLDLFEVDAASRTKVEDTRELLDNVLYPPTQGRYKVYLIDEVHMLSNHSFNALLKTLEEPPPHVKFLLATTDPKRLPITILSRCLQFHLKRITPEQIAKHLQHICYTENIAHETQALDTLAVAADGSMRDALSLLDQGIAYGNGAVHYADVRDMLGSMAHDDLAPLITALAAQDGERLFTAMGQLAEDAPDYEQVLETMISLFHQLALGQIVPSAVTLSDTLRPLLSQLRAEEIQLYYQIALLGRRDLSLTPSPQQGFEMTLLRMLAFKPGNASIAPTATHTTQRTTPSSTPSHEATPVPQAAAATHPASPPAAASSVPLTDWRDILPKLGLTGMAYAFAANCAIEAMQEHRITLAVSTLHQAMLNQKLQERISEALNRYFQRPMQLEIQFTTKALATPLKQQQSEQAQALSAARASILEREDVKNLIDMYDATVKVSLLS